METRKIAFCFTEFILEQLRFVHGNRLWPFALALLCHLGVPSQLRKNRGRFGLPPRYVPMRNDAYLLLPAQMLLFSFLASGDVLAPSRGWKQSYLFASLPFKVNGRGAHLETHDSVGV